VKRIVIGVMHPAPYRQPVLDQICSAGVFDVDVLSNRALDVGHAWAGFGEANGALYRGNGIAALFRALGRYVFSQKYDFVCWSAYHPYWLTLPIVLSALMGKKYAIALDSVREEGGGWLARKIKKLIFGRASFLWVPGLASRRFLQDGYGIPAGRIVEGVYVLKRFEGFEKFERFEGVTFLTVCNNIPLRRVDALVDGFMQLAKGRTGVRLVLCGKNMQGFVGPNVEVIDGCPWNELPRLYARADVYVHNGAEQFSTAVLMASMLGMPIVVGREVGIVKDMFRGDVHPGICVDEWKSADAWAAAFEQIIVARNQWQTMGQAGQKQADKFDVDKVADSIIIKIKETL